MLERTFRNAKQVIEFRKAIGLLNMDRDSDAVSRFGNGVELFHKAGPRSTELSEFLKTYGANTTPVSDVLNLVGGSALQVQSLDRTAVSLVASEAAYRFLNQCPRVDVASTFLEFNRTVSWSGKRYADAFVGETADPDFDEPVLERAAHNMAFLASAWSESHVLSQVDTTEDPESFLQMGALHGLLETKSRSVWYGNRTLRSVEFSGFEAELEANSSLVYDAEGALPSVDVIKGLTEEVRYPGYGMANMAWMSVGTKRAWANYLISQSAERVHYPTAQAAIGTIIPGINDENAADGVLKFMDDNFLDRASWRLEQYYDRTNKTWIEGAIGDNAPNPPTGTATRNAGPVAGSKWKAGDVNTAKVNYRVIAYSLTGKSAPSAAIQSDVAPAATDSVSLVLTPGVGGAQTIGYEIYRETMPGNGIYRFVRRIARNMSTATTTYTDLNAYRPGTDIVVLGDFNSMGGAAESSSRTYAMGVLLPPMATKFDRGIVSLRKLGGMVEEYCGLRIFAPSKFRLIRNVPSSSGS